MTIKNRVVYMAVRQSTDADYPWVDVMTASGNPDVCRQKAANHDFACPTWAAINPVQRIARFDLQEAS